MVEQYWKLFYSSLIGMIVLTVILVLGLIFVNNLFFTKKHGIPLFIVTITFLVFMIAFTAKDFILCCKDYNLVTSEAYIEVKAEMIEYTSVKKDSDGNGLIIYRKPKFYIPEENKYIILYTKDVEIGKTYTIRYYPNTKICEVNELAN